MDQTRATNDYAALVAAEQQKWASHMRAEAAQEWNAWLDHPIINEHYRKRAALDGQQWESWAATYLGHPATRSLDLGCGTGSRSFAVLNAGGSIAIEGVDVTEERIAQAEQIRNARGAAGRFWAEDVNRVRLQRRAYELVFSAHSFHHFIELEYVMEQVHEALTDNGLFILEEFVGPTQFQWTDEQIAITRSLLGLIPPDLRMLRWNARKDLEGRPTVEEVVAASPFESIRSAEITPLFKRYFDIVAIRNLGGTIQHLLYNGIAHNFRIDDERAVRAVRGVFETEDALVDSGLLPSDFMLLVGRRKR